jgi:hypothetical protein
MRDRLGGPDSIAERGAQQAIEATCDGGATRLESSALSIRVDGHHEG